ncbi:hypothetical protein BBJ28_00001703 [Nothophytophthora sp. Chile5]|nr:hypothetical protein BBJ28_00001703 [Nothophytophthora sp. Chile5]
MAPQFGLKLETLALALQTTALLWLWWRQSHHQSADDITPSQQQRINLENDANKKEKARADERRGRVAAEKAKISPPMLKERVGIFCTRSPHRPNPIGITLAKIERVDMRNRTVFLSGVDLLNETPVLDVKPYISGRKAHTIAFRTRKLLTGSPRPSHPLSTVDWESAALIPAIHKLAETSTHYRNATETFVAAIEEVLKVDVRSKYQTRRWTSPDYVNYQVVDNARVQYRFALVPPPPSYSDGSSDIDTARIQISDVEEVASQEREKNLAEVPPPAAKRNRSRVAKPKKKKIKEKANCVGFFVDALDKKMLWSEAKIIACNLATQKIRVHFVGWGKSYDLWTDPMSITSHGRYAPRSIKAPDPKSWNGDMHLFEDMLGPIEGATFTSVQAPASAKPASSITTNGKLTEKKSVRTKAASARAPPKAAVKGKVVANGTIIVKKPTAKRAAPAVKAKLKPEQPPAKKRQKLATPETATAASRPATKTRVIKKKKDEKDAAPPDLPMFRQLELDDGTLVDFAAQREEAREEREGTQSFLARCALIWKQQAKTLSV